MKAKDLIAPIAALLAAAGILLGVSALLGETARRGEEAARNEIMSYMLPGRPASFTEEAYDGEDESIRRVFKAEDGYVLELETNEAAVGEDIDALTGATVTSKAVTRAVNSAVAFVTGADISSSATEWEG